MQHFFLIFLAFFSSAYANKDSNSIDALIGKVAQEPVLRSDLKRFKEVVEILVCAGLRDKARVPSGAEKVLFDAYVEEEMMYFEAKEKKLSRAGIVSEGVSAIHKRPQCKSAWIEAGERYNKAWQTKTRAREGQGMLVRELEKRLVVDKFLGSDPISDSELWKREARARYPVKTYIE